MRGNDESNLDSKSVQATQADFAKINRHLVTPSKKKHVLASREHSSVKLGLNWPNEVGRGVAARSHDQVKRNWIAPAQPEAVSHLTVRRGLSGGMLPVGRDPSAYVSVKRLHQEQQESVVANQSFRANREVQLAVDRQNRGPGWGSTQQQQAHAAQAHALQHRQQNPPSALAGESWLLHSTDQGPCINGLL